MNTPPQDGSVSEHHHHESQIRRFLRTYRFEISWLIVVALGIFLIFERLNIRSSFLAWLTRVAAATLYGVEHLDEMVAASLARTTLSDVVGFVLVLGALAAILLRVRWRAMHNPALAVLRCPRCDGSIHRVHRRPADRLVNLLVPVHRYRCADAQCGWRGFRIGSRHGPSRKSARK